MKRTIVMGGLLGLVLGTTAWTAQTAPPARGPALEQRETRVPDGNIQVPSPSSAQGPTITAPGGTVELAPDGPSPLKPTDPANPNRWRYKYHNGRWWYYQTNQQWVVWDGSRWIPYEAGKTNPASPYTSGYRGAETNGTVNEGAIIYEPDNSRNARPRRARRWWLY